MPREADGLACADIPEGMVATSGKSSGRGMMRAFGSHAISLLQKT